MTYRLLSERHHMSTLFVIVPSSVLMFALTHKDTRAMLDMATSTKKPTTATYLSIALITISLGATQVPPNNTSLAVKKGSHIVLIGNNLGSRMMNYGYFETEMHLRHPDSLLFIRNMCDAGDTPGFRPHPGRPSPWAFPGAEAFQTELARNSGSEGHFETPDQWLTRLEADIIIAFFGYNESFQGEPGLSTYKAELEAFIRHTLSQRYNGKSPPQLAIVSPIAFEDRSNQFDLPDGKRENANLALYTQAMREVAAKTKVHFVDVFRTLETMV